MTITEEIVQAMQSGTNTMFLRGFWILTRTEPAELSVAIEKASEIVRMRREVCIIDRKKKTRKRKILTGKAPVIGTPVLTDFLAREGLG